MQTMPVLPATLLLVTLGSALPKRETKCRKPARSVYFSNCGVKSQPDLPTKPCLRPSCKVAVSLTRFRATLALARVLLSVIAARKGAHPESFDEEPE
jgi:hypothetical protein